MGDLPCAVLSGVGELGAGPHVTLIAAVVDADADVAAALQELAHLLRRLPGVGDGKRGQMAFVLPHVHPVRDQSSDAKANAVRQVDEGVAPDGQPVGQVSHVGAYAGRVERVEIIPDRPGAVIEVVVAERHEAVAGGVECGSDWMGQAPDGCAVVVACVAADEQLGVRGALQCVAAVHGYHGHRFAVGQPAYAAGPRVVREILGHIEQAAVFGVAGGVVDGEDVTMGVGCVADAECSCHA